MFLNIRIIVAATSASVVALICGFAMFAALRVSHEPLTRLPPANAPLQRLADDGAPPALAFAAAEPFDRRFQIGEAKSSAELTASLTRMLERREGVESTPAILPATPDQGAAVTQNVAAVEPTKEPVTAPVAQPADEPVETSAGATDPALTAPAPPDAVTAEPAPIPAPSIAAIEPPTEQALPPEPPKLESEAAPASVTKPAAHTSQPVESTAKKTKHKHAAKAHRHRSLSAVAQSWPQTTHQAYAQPNFQSVPQGTQPQPARQRHAKIASRKTNEPAIGGPLVGAPSR
jgi:hypothetical protein